VCVCVCVCVDIDINLCGMYCLIFYSQVSTYVKRNMYETKKCWFSGIPLQRQVLAYKSGALTLSKPAQIHQNVG
jgi:hypothetical protein